MTRLKCLKPRFAPKGNPGGWQPDEHRGSSMDRGYGSYAWKKTRQRILDRDERLCQPCLRENRVSVATEVDHIVSKAHGKAKGWTTQQIESDSNLQAICNPCHKVKTARESNITP